MGSLCEEHVTRTSFVGSLEQRCKHRSAGGVRHNEQMGPFLRDKCPDWGEGQCVRQKLLTLIFKKQAENGEEDYLNEIHQC